MAEIFKTVVVLSIFGFVLTALLLIIKPMTSKKLPASWQYYIWVLVMLSMLIPVYKIIPSKEIYKIPVVPSVTTESPALPNLNETENTAQTEDAVNENAGAPLRKSRVPLYTIAAFIWLSGFLVYLSIVTSFLQGLKSSAYKVFVHPPSYFWLQPYRRKFHRLRLKRNIKDRKVG